MNKSFIWGAVSILIALLVGAYFSHQITKSHFKAILDDFSPKVDTITIRDTITQYKPKEVAKIVYKDKIIKVPVVDTLIKTDTIYFPTEQKIYKDSNYEAWVSGVRPNLDSIKVFSTTTMVTKEVPKVVHRKFTFGLQGGGGIVKPIGGEASLGYYIGGGIQYTF